MKTLYYRGKERKITKDLVREILADDTKTDKMGAGYDKESNTTLELVRGYEFYALPVITGNNPDANEAEIGNKVDEVICEILCNELLEA